jgi:membrane-associated phospholipid phosphatase
VIRKTPSPWSTVVQALTRPYPVTLSMVALALLVPLYIFIAETMPGRSLHAPELALDRFFPLRPVWGLVYGSLYLFLIALPAFVIRQEDQIRRTVRAYLMVWIVAYVCFLVYPTRAPRPAEVAGNGFAVWGLRFLYEADPPYNCFPSLHVAHSFVSALACFRVHRGVGIVAGLCSALVGVSTLFTRQHYVLDVVAGIVLAGAAYLVFLRSFRREDIPDLDRRSAPILAAGLMVVVAVAVVGVWVAFEWRRVPSPGSSREPASAVSVFARRSAHGVRPPAEAALRPIFTWRAAPAAGEFSSKGPTDVRRGRRSSRQRRRGPTD